MLHSFMAVPQSVMYSWSKLNLNVDTAEVGNCELGPGKMIHNFTITLQKGKPIKITYLVNYLETWIKLLYKDSSNFFLRYNDWLILRSIVNFDLQVGLCPSAPLLDCWSWLHIQELTYAKDQLKYVNKVEKCQTRRCVNMINSCLHASPTTRLPPPFSGRFSCFTKWLNNVFTNSGEWIDAFPCIRFLKKFLLLSIGY